MEGLKAEQTREKFIKVAGAFGRAYGNDRLSDEKMDAAVPILLDVGVNDLEFYESEAKEMIAGGIIDAMEAKLRITN